MFPLPAIAPAASNPRAAVDDDEGDPLQILLLNTVFLDQVVQVDEKTARKRANVAFHNMSLMRRQARIEFGDGQALPVTTSLVNGVGVDDGITQHINTNTSNADTENGLAVNGLAVNGERDDDHDHADEVWGLLGNGNGNGIGNECGRDARGKTVRELSRLWMYIGGASPPPSPPAD